MRPLVFFPGWGASDDADIVGGGAQHLGLDRLVVLVAPGHDHYIIALLHGDEVGQPGVVHQPGLLHAGEELRAAELRPVLQHHAAEVHRGQGGHQGLGDVAAAEDIHPARLEEGLAVVTPAAVGELAGLAAQSAGEG